jgi:F0F1-type ATP synthase assembly protein I
MSIALAIVLSAVGAAAWVAVGLFVDRVLDWTVGYGDGYVADKVVNTLCWPHVALSLAMIGLMYAVLHPVRCWGELADALRGRSS